MTKREIIKNLITRKPAERMGWNEHFWPHILENSWNAQGYPKDVPFGKEFDLDIQSTYWYTLTAPRPDLEAVLEETQEWVVKRNGWGSILKNWKHQAGTPEHVGFTLTSVEAWKKDFKDAVQSLNVIPSAENIKLIKTNYDIARTDDRFQTMSMGSIFEMLRLVMGDVFMLESLILEKEMVHEFNEIAIKKIIEHFEYIFKNVGLPDGMHIYDDLGYTAAPFCGKDLHNEMILPYHKKLHSFFKDYNLPIILHTCGDFRIHIPAIIESGVDCIQALEAKTGMDVVKLAEAYKDKLCFMGNINVMELESGNRERIKNEILYKINGMKKLKAPYIFMSDHSISPAVKLEDYRYMAELFWKNCKY